MVVNHLLHLNLMLMRPLSKISFEVSIDEVFESKFLNQEVFDQEAFESSTKLITTHQINENVN